MEIQINFLIKKLYACLPRGMALLIIAVLFIATAKAQIVYTDVNPDSTITSGVLYTSVTCGLDLNKDGTMDFNILAVHTGYWTPVYMVKVTPLNTNEILDSLFQGNDLYPIALTLNSYVGAFNSQPSTFN